MSHIIDAKLPDVSPILLWALELPDYARPEYFIKAHQQSGWSKSVFLRTLLNEVEHYETLWQIYSGKEKSALKKKNVQLPQDYGIDLDKETSGRQKGKLTKKVLDELRFGIEQAYKWDLPEPTFDGYQIIAFCERLLLFVKGQFEEQIKPYYSVDSIVEKLKKKGHNIEGKPTHVVYSYDIITDAPVGSIYRLKREIRKLLLNSQNPEALKSILQPVRELCIQIVDLWNKDLQPLDQPLDEKDMYRSVRERRLMAFNYSDISMWHRNVRDDDEYYREPSLHFMNRDFAVFAANVSNLISYEVLQEKKTARNFRSIKHEYLDFDDLFIKTDNLNKAYALLIDEELIGPDLNYIGGLKSSFCIWVRELIKCNVIQYVGDDELTTLLNKKFSGLKISRSTFRSNMTKALKDFQPRISKAIAQL